MTTIFLGRAGARGESFGDTARRVGEVSGVTIPSDATDAEVLELIGEAAVGDIHTGVLVPRLNDPTAAAENVAAIQAALDLGGLVQIRGTGVATINAPLVIRSNTLLDVSKNLVILLAPGSNCNALQNAGVTAARTVLDAAVTASSTTLTSATGAFTGADVGKTVWVYGADTQGEPLKTTIASVTNGTTVVMATAAVTTVAATQASVGPRDSNIHVRGGIWDRGTNGAGAANASGGHIRFRRCDDFTISDLRVINGQSGSRYAVHVADVTDYTIERLSFDYISDGVHVTGPARRGRIVDLRGYTLDDMVSLTPADWPGMDDVFGDIVDHTIEDIRPFLTTNTVVKVLGGKGGGTQVLTTRHIRVRNISGCTISTAQPTGGLVHIGDDYGMTSTWGGFLDDILVENVGGVVPSTGTAKNNLVFINASNAQRIRVKGVAVSVPTAITQHAVYIGPLSNVAELSVQECSIQSASNTSDLVRIDSTSGTAAAGTLLIKDCSILTAGGRSLVRLVGSTAYVYRLIMSGCDMRTGYAFVEAPTTGSRVDSLAMGNCLGGTLTFLAELAGTTALHLSNVSAALSNSSLNIAHSAANVTVYAADSVFLNNKEVVTTGGYQLASKGFGFAVDVSKITNKATGDRASNTSNANTGTLGVGPCVWTGTAWKSLVSGNTF